MPYEGYDEYGGWGGAGSGYYNGGRQTTIANTTKENKKPVETKELLENITKEIIKFIDSDKTTILLEPNVDIKLKQLMAIAGNKEIFGKLIIDMEGRYLVVKDILVPEQTATSASFKSDKEDIGKFMYSLFFKDNNPATKQRRTPEEVEAISKKLRGHFHSHNSVSPSSIPSPSGVDTDDMMDQIEDRDYWIEIIGTMAGYSGRILLNSPTRIWSTLDVKIKWWKDIENMLNDVSGKLKDTSYSYDKDDTKKEEKLESWKKYKCDVCEEERYGSYLEKISGKWLCWGCANEVRKRLAEKNPAKTTEVVKGKKQVPLGKGGQFKRDDQYKKSEGKVGEAGSLLNSDTDEYCTQCDKKIVGSDFEYVGADVVCLDCLTKLYNEDLVTTKLDEEAVKVTEVEKIEERHYKEE
jgi:hypothetical protein